MQTNSKLFKISDSKTTRSNKVILMKLLSAQNSAGFSRQLAALAALIMASLVSTSHGQSEFVFQSGDNVCYIGNTLADRMQHYPWLETYLTQANADKEITFRNLGFSADEIKTGPALPISDRRTNGSPSATRASCSAFLVTTKPCAASPVCLNLNLT